ncbi:MAG: protein transport protein bos1 [Chaenotheca gracillima]|nr:MAG: protein transport protein bos1 [Chaenotheca gracillima]
MLLSSSYILPALIFNPVLFLHGINTIISRVISLSSSGLHMPTWGPHVILPALDIHDHDALCWSYTVFMVGVQLVAFTRVGSIRRANSKEIKLAQGVEEDSDPDDWRK